MHPTSQNNRFSSFAIVALAAVLPSVSPAAAQQQGLILTDSTRVVVVEAANALSQILVDKGMTATILEPTGPLGDLSPYACVWDLRVDVPLGAGDLADYQAYAVGGGSAYFSGEHPVFAPRNNSLTALVNSLGGGLATIDNNPIAGPVATDIVETVNPSHLLASSCDTVFEVVYDGVLNGQFLTFGNGTWLTHTTRPIPPGPDGYGAAIWDAGTLSGAPNATIAIALDINWLSDGPTGTLDFKIAGRPFFPTENRTMVQNMVSLLCDVSCCPPIVPLGGALPALAASSAASPCSAPSSL